MPLTEEFLDFTRSRGFDEFKQLLGRVLKPAGSVLTSMGPAASRLAHDVSMVDDQGAQGMGKYLSETLPLDAWEKIAPEKRVLAGRYQHGWLSPTEESAALADPDIARMVSNMDDTWTRANAETLAATDPFGNKVQVRNPFTGEKRDYEGISGRYFPRMIKRGKRDAILDPMNYAQSQLERMLTTQRLGEVGLEEGGLLSPEQAQEIRDTASDAIDDFFRTGQPNEVIQDKKLLSSLQPAYDTFQELHQHMYQLNVNQALRRRAEIPPEMDPIIELFGSDDPTQQRQGIRFLREFLLRDAQNARRFGSIESSRALLLPRDWYEEDPLRIVPLYLLRHQRRLAEIGKFGQDNELVLGDNGLLAKIPNETDRAFAKKVFDRAMGLEPYNKSLKLNNLMDWAYATQVTKLGTAQISQLGQIMNVIMETGLGPTWHALTNLSKSRDIALRSGATLTRVMDIVREGLADPTVESTPRRFIEGVLRWTGFDKMDLLARHIGAGAGYAHGQAVLQKVIQDPTDLSMIRELRRLIPGARKDQNLFTPILEKIASIRQATGGKTSLEAIEEAFRPELENIARQASLNSNFRNSVLDLPLWATTPLGKLIMLFRTFAYKQTLFMANRVMEDLKAGNPRSFIGIAAGAGLLGPAISLLKSVPQGHPGQTAQEYADVWEGLNEGDARKAALKAAENITIVGGMGIFDQVLRAIKNGDLGWYEFIMGPLFTDMVRLTSGTGSLLLGGTGYGKPGQTITGARELGKFVGAHIPVVGGAINRAVRTTTENVERYPTGIVTRPDSPQPLGTEEPPMQIGGLTLPPASVLFGFQESVFAKRQRLMDDLKNAIDRGDREEIKRILDKSREQNVRISPESVNRLIRQKMKTEQEARS